LPFVFLSKAKLLSHLGKGGKTKKRKEKKRREED
jgi:hypothetical protein